MSGLNQAFAKCSYLQNRYRGFKSHLLRQFNLSKFMSPWCPHELNESHQVLNNTRAASVPIFIQLKKCVSFLKHDYFMLLLLLLRFQRAKNLFYWRFFMVSLIQFYSFVIRLAILLSLTGQLKTCTLTMMGLAATKSERGIISYSKYTKLLTSKSLKWFYEGGLYWTRWRCVPTVFYLDCRFEKENPAFFERGYKLQKYFKN